MVIPSVRVSTTGLHLQFTQRTIHWCFSTYICTISLVSIDIPSHKELTLRDNILHHHLILIDSEDPSNVCRARLRARAVPKPLQHPYLINWFWSRHGITRISHHFRIPPFSPCTASHREWIPDRVRGREWREGVGVAQRLRAVTQALEGLQTK